MPLSPTKLHHSVCPSPVELLQQLIRFDTTNPPGNERECVDHIADILTRAGCQPALLGRSSERPNLIARLPGAGAAPPLLLYGHVDVVAADNQQWQHPPFDGKLVENYVWGRGALDMKGGIVMMLTAFLRAKAEGLPLPGDVVLALVSDEEGGGDYGARYLVENHADLFQGIRYAIGEFGGFTYNIGRRKFYPIMVAEKQACWLRATVRGPAGHGSLSHRGGAMAHLARLLQQLEQKRLPAHITPATRQMVEAMTPALPFHLGALFRLLLNRPLTGPVLRLMGTKGLPFQPLFRNTVNATMVSGGQQINVTPSEAVVDLDGRLLPGHSPEAMIAELGNIVGNEVELELVRHESGPTDPNMGLFDTLAGILRRADPQGAPIPVLLPAATDARFFSRLGIQTYGFIPMQLPPDFNFAETLHGPDERIPGDALTFGGEAIYQLLQRFGDR